jgi:hypothetical protein
MNKTAMLERLRRTFPPDQADTLAEVIHDAYNSLVKVSDFNELKAVVVELAEAQQRTEMRVVELAEAQQRTEMRLAELAEAQQRTELRVVELAEAQQRTEMRLAELAEGQRQLIEAQRRTEERMDKLAEVVQGLAIEVGSLSRTMSYALENEAYRALPALLKRKLGLELEQRFVRTEINGEEINLFGQARRNGQTVLIVGESKLRLDMRSFERQDVFDQLGRKVEAVRQAYPDREIIPVLVTHYARPAFVQEAEARGVLVFQSFDW